MDTDLRHSEGLHHSHSNYQPFSESVVDTNEFLWVSVGWKDSRSFTFFLSRFLLMRVALQVASLASWETMQIIYYSSLNINDMLENAKIYKCIAVTKTIFGEFCTRNSEKIARVN